MRRKRDKEPLEIEALLWAWTNLNGRLPDRNTMTAAEIAEYWESYSDIIRRAVVKLTGLEPDEYAQRRGNQ